MEEDVAGGIAIFIVVVAITKSLMKRGNGGFPYARLSTPAACTAYTALPSCRDMEVCTAIPKQLFTAFLPFMQHAYCKQMFERVAALSETLRLMSPRFA